MTAHFDALAHHFHQNRSVDAACRAVQACPSSIYNEPTYIGCVFCEFTASIIHAAVGLGVQEVAMPLVHENIVLLCQSSHAEAHVRT
jgi:hypothetical protein